MQYKSIQFSRILDPIYSPEAEEFLLVLQNRLVWVAMYLGYTEPEISEIQTKSGTGMAAALKFRELWKMPDCGEKNSEILDKLARYLKAPYHPSQGLQPMITGNKDRAELIR